MTRARATSQLGLALAPPHRPPVLRLWGEAEIVADNFAGGGGASTGIEMALGRSPDLAINHDPEAIAMHAANHPATRHYCESVWTVDPVAACQGRPVALAWFSPDCTFHSKARGGKPFRDPNRAKRRRGLAWIVTRWARAVRPRVVILENVEEFEDWGPLDAKGRPDPAKRGLTFRRWVAQLRNLGYVVEWRQLRACDYGAPTTRRRLFVIARCDGHPITWPEPTHGPGRAEPYRTAADCIDWTIPAPSIFARDRDLAENTMRRIARGLRRYVLESPAPFVVGDLAPALVQTGYGERPGQAPRALNIRAPLGTVVGGGAKHALITAFLAKHYGGNYDGPGASLAEPMGTVTTIDHHAAVTASLAPVGAPPAPTDRREQVRAFLLSYYGTDQDPQIAGPLPTVTTRDRFALVTVAGVEYEIRDIGMRMLTPRELYRAQGFPETYRIDAPTSPALPGLEAAAALLTKEAQIRMCGNAVCPPLAAALVRANVNAARRAEEAA